jgi:hypothetical protein
VAYVVEDNGVNPISVQPINASFVFSTSASVTLAAVDLTRTIVAATSNCGHVQSALFNEAAAYAGRFTRTRITTVTNADWSRFSGGGSAAATSVFAYAIQAEISAAGPVTINGVVTSQYNALSSLTGTVSLSSSCQSVASLESSQELAVETDCSSSAVLSLINEGTITAPVDAILSSVSVNNSEAGADVAINASCFSLSGHGSNSSSTVSTSLLSQSVVSGLLDSIVALQLVANIDSISGSSFTQVQFLSRLGSIASSEYGQRSVSNLAAGIGLSADNAISLRMFANQSNGVLPEIVASFESVTSTAGTGSAFAIIQSVVSSLSPPIISESEALALVRINTGAIVSSSSVSAANSFVTINSAGANGQAGSAVSQVSVAADSASLLSIIMFATDHPATTAVVGCGKLVYRNKSCVVSIQNKTTQLEIECHY